MRAINRLTAISLERFKGRGRHADGAGLWLNVTHSGSKSWVYRWARKGRVREMGLGPFPAISLSNARNKAFECRQMVANGLDPKLERDRQTGKTFGETADLYFENMQSRWSSDATRKSWQKTLTNICAPIRNKFVADLETSDVLRIIKPMWAEVPTAASATRGRIENVLDLARSNGWRESENPARWRGHLSNVLPSRDRRTIKHHAAMDYADIPEFMAKLRDVDTVASWALQMLVLTASRRNEIIDAKWDEFDLVKAVWIVPSERTKVRREHRVPLIDDMVSILQPIHEMRFSDYVFSSRTGRNPVDKKTLVKLMQKLGCGDATLHGFCSTFRDWSGDKTSFSRETAENALSHLVGSETERAYCRSDGMEKRKQLMIAWSDYCRGQHNNKVVQLHG